MAKTGSARTLPMSAMTAQAVKTLIGCRHSQWGQNVPVFCSAAGTPFRNDTWGHRLERYGKQLGIKVYPYSSGTLSPLSS